MGLILAEPLCLVLQTEQTEIDFQWNIHLSSIIYSMSSGDLAKLLTETVCQSVWQNKFINLKNSIPHGTPLTKLVSLFQILT